jgi:hypothetical protein
VLHLSLCALSHTPHLPHYLRTDNVGRNMSSWVTNLIQIIDSVRSAIVFLSVFKKCFHISTVKSFKSSELKVFSNTRTRDFSSVLRATYYDTFVCYPSVWHSYAIFFARMKGKFLSFLCVRHNVIFIACLIYSNSWTSRVALKRSIILILAGPRNQ